MLTTVILDGYLPARLGCRRVWALELGSRSPREAVRALCAVVPGFRELLREESEPGYHVLVGSRDLGATELDAVARPTEAITIMPALTGAKNVPVLQVVLGSVLVAAGAVMTFTGFGAAAAPYLISAGVSMMLGGVSALLFGAPTPTGPKEKSSENQPNYVFDGPVNTMTQGHCVPLCYGRMRVGSQVVSAAMDVSWPSGGGFGGGADGSRGPGGEPPVGGNCPAPWTPVTLSCGRTLPAGELRSGMLVRAAHEATLTWGNYRVEAVSYAVAECMEVEFTDGRRLVASLNHRVHVENAPGRSWVELQDLHPDLLLTGEPPGLVTACRYLGDGPVVRVTVDGAHTYLTAGVLSHNIKKAPADLPMGPT